MISKHALDERLGFLQLDSGARERLRLLGPLFEQELPDALDHLYAQIDNFAAVRALFRRGDSVDRARKAQSDHWKALLSSQFGEDYAAEAWATGETHAQIGLEPRWYLGGYAIVLADMVGSILAMRRPGAGQSANGRHFDDLSADIGALIKASFLDADLGLTCYIEAAQRTERATAQRLAMALKAAHAGVVEVDFGNETTWCSPEVSRYLGRTISFNDFARQPETFCHSDDVDHFTKLVEKWPGVGLEEFEFRARQPSGRYRWVKFFGELGLDQQGNRTRLVAMVADVHPRKKQELALVAAERVAQDAAHAKSQFLANMSHEIRTPMNGVLGVLGLLEREQLSDDGRRLLAEAQGCGRMLSQLLNDILDSSKIEAGKLELNPEPLDVADALHSVVSVIRPQAEAKGLTLRAHVDGSAGWVVADPVRLRQMLFNLIGNAVKFTNSGTVEVRLATRDDTSGGRRIRFEIEDTGIGIPAQAQKYLFSRFRQADSSTERRFGGTGLGLNITRSIAQMMGGDVGFKSREGEGSVFWVEFTAPTTPPSLSSHEDRVVTPLEGFNLLVVDDNPTNRLVATRVLESLGAVVDVAEDGLHGLEALSLRAYDAILMDVEMPRMGGLEATRRIRVLPGPVGATPIIGLTANVQPQKWLEYRAAGMDGVVGKPFSIAELVSEISRTQTARASEGKTTERSIAPG